MAKSSRAYKSAKRSKELDRLRKREEKRRRRMAAKSEGTAEEQDASAETAAEQPGPEEDTDPIIPRE
ncbi:MAG TPA: hypothetical protein PK207_06355 [Candidatus Aminicenantes bacterium]|nr:hypothetical protein [Candidatus Aminicenantes bacterium]